MGRLAATFKDKRIFLETFMVAVTMIYVIPAWMVLINSLKASKDAFKLGLGIPRDGWHFENYVNVFGEANILRGLFNGVFIAVVTIILGLGISSIASFVIARRNTRVTNTAYGFFIAGIIIPQPMASTPKDAISFSQLVSMKKDML
jgi:raffinose/stachyose/melibiose transport system permease protein